jgi:cell division protein FtsZ
MFELVDNVPQCAEIKVVGVGGGGGNAVQHMLANNVSGVEFICANTDAQALKNVTAPTIIQLGGQVTKGLGAGANPAIGREAAVEDKDRIREVLGGADMVFVTAGMGGGTGTGGAPVVAEIAREMGILTVAVVTKPFPFEGRKRKKVAEEGIAELSQYVDSLITIPNEKLLPVLGANVGLLEAFRAANDVLLGAVQGIADLIIRPGMINVDFADVRAVMSEMGMAMMGTGIGRGEHRAREAAEAAIRSPLLDDVNLHGARGILVNITAGESLTLGEFSEVGDRVEEFASENATVVVGTVIDEELQDDLRVTVVATGLGQAEDLSSRLVESSKEQHASPSTIGLRGMEQPAVFRSKSDAWSGYGSGKRPAALEPAVPEAEQRQAEPALEGVTEGGSEASDYLDIPAFLRRRSD